MIDQRVKIIESSGDKIAEQVDVPIEYAQAAIKRYGQKIVRERVNIDKICEGAARELKEKTNEEKESEKSEIDSDWLNAFEDVAAPVSSEEMQRRLSKILAQEIQQPGAFSIRTIKLVGNLDKDVLKLFQKLCSLCISLVVPTDPPRMLDARALSLTGSAAQNALATYGLDFGRLNILNEYGLLISDYNSYYDYGLSVAREINGQLQVSLPFEYQNQFWGLVNKNPPAQEVPNIKLHGVALSKAGTELFRIIDLVPNDGYTTALQTFFDSQGFELRPSRSPVNGSKKTTSEEVVS